VACATCGTELRTNAKFCDECGTAVSSAFEPAEYKQVTVLFADVVHSMDIATAVGAERWREIMAELVSRAGEVVQRYGATVDQFTGDGIMAVFGAPLALEDHAFRACLAALDIQEETSRLAGDVERNDGVGLKLRIGLNSGQVVAGDIGSRSFGYTAIGEQVGMAQRMESVAPPGGVMLSESAARLVEHIMVMDDPELVYIKNTSCPVRARRLMGVVPDRALIGHSDSTLVGREWEMSAIGAILERSTKDCGCVVNLVGPAGIGKSRTVSETAAIAKNRGIDVCWACCESHTSEVPFRVAADLVRSVLGITSLDAIGAREYLRSRLPHASDDDLRLLDDFVGIAEPGVIAPAIDPDARRRRLTALIDSVLIANSPRLLVVEDAHWIDEASESVVGDLLSAMPQTHSLAVITYRPEYNGSLANMAGAQTISLGPLSDSEMMNLLDELLGPDLSLRTIRTSIAGRAAGNPFFAQEMVRELADRGVLDGARGNYRCATDITDVKVPATLQATLAARIDRLSPGAKRTLNAGAVIGSRFDGDLLIDVVDSAQVSPLIEAELIDRVVVGPRAQYAFRHPLIRAVAYESQLKSDRAELHHRLAMVIQHRDAESSDESAALIAEHLEAAGDLAGAYAWHMRAGSWLMGRDVGAARLSWQRARRVADALPSGFPDRIRLRIHPRTLLCITTWRVGASPEATGFDELRELCISSDTDVSLVSGFSGALLSLTMANRHHDAARLASEQIALFDSADDPMSMFSVMSAAMFAKMHGGEVIEARRVAQAVIDLAAGDAAKGNIPQWGLGSPLAVALCYRAHCRASLGDIGWRADLKHAIAIQRELTEAVVVIVVTYGYSVAVTNGLLLPDAAALGETADVLRHAEQSGDDIALALAQIARGLLLTYSAPNNCEDGRDLMAKAREAKLSQRDLLSVAIVDIRTAQLSAQAGKLDDAIAIAQVTLKELIDSGERFIRGAASAALVTALLMRGHDSDVREAEVVVERLAATPTDPGFVLNDIWLLRLRALLARARGDEISYRELLHRYRATAELFGFEGHMAMAEAMA
jgi:adenylate cyclase